MCLFHTDQILIKCNRKHKNILFFFLDHVLHSGDQRRQHCKPSQHGHGHHHPEGLGGGGGGAGQQHAGRSVFLPAYHPASCDRLSDDFSEQTLTPDIGSLSVLPFMSLQFLLIVINYSKDLNNLHEPDDLYPPAVL